MFDVRIVLLAVPVIAAAVMVAVPWLRSRRQRSAFHQHHERPPVETWEQRYADANRIADAQLREAEAPADIYMREQRRRLAR